MREEQDLDERVEENQINSDFQIKNIQYADNSAYNQFPYVNSDISTIDSEKKDNEVYSKHKEYHGNKDNIDHKIHISHKSSHPGKKNKSPHNKKESSSWQDKIKKNTLSFLNNRYNLAFLVILIIGLSLRLKYFNMESLWNDAAVHLWYAIKATKEPLFMFSSEFITGDHVIVQTLTAFIYLFTKNAFLAGKIVALFFGAIGIIFIYLLGSELKNKFMGLIAAALLSFHHLFWFYGVRVLADAPLVSTVIVTIYCLVKLEKNKTLFWAISSGVMFLVMMLIKKQSIFFLVGFLVYLIIFKRKEAINNKSILVSWVIPLSALVVASFVFGSSFFNSFFSRFIILDGVHDPGLKVLNFFPWIFQWYILVPMILGLILIVIIYKKKEYYLFLTLFFIYYLGFELTVRTPEDRYIMPLFPIGLFIAIFAIMEIASYITLFLEKKFHFLKKILIVIFVIFLCWNFYSIGDPLIISKEKSYAGHQEAGEWLLENVPDDTPIFAGSPRMVRAFIGREYGGPGRFDEGGNLWYLRAEEYLNDKSAFERDITQLSKESDIYLEIDVWEYTQPSWYFPLTQDSINYFVGQGFNLVKVVDREVNTPQGKRNVSVIFILKKDKGSLNQNLNNMTVKKAT